MGAYDKVWVEGHLLNKRTAAIYNQIKVVFETLGGTGGIYLIQGSYNKGVSTSAGTHDGGGAFDIAPKNKTSRNWTLLQKAARMCMVADWDRPTLSGVWSHHNHGIVIGDKQMSGAAANQVRDYYAHRNGLAGHGSDNTWHPSVLFSPVYPMRTVNLARVQREARKTRGRVPLLGVFRIQRALNKKLGTSLRVDGIYGKATKAAMAHWEHVVGGDGDGIPGRYALTLLGAGRFNVK